MMHNKRIVVEISKAGKLIMTIDENMLSCEFGALDRGNITDVADWGIYANRGSVSFIDNAGYFNNQNTNSTEIKKYKVNFYLAKTSRSKIAVFNIENLTFDEETREVNIELISGIINLQRKFPIYKISYPFGERNALYLLGLEDNFSNETEEKDYHRLYPSFGLKKGDDAKELERVVIYCPFLDEKNAWDRIAKICQATMCRVVEDENGNPIITGSFPDRKATLVRPNNILYISDSNFVKIENTSIDVTNREKRSSRKVEQISKHFDIQYDENGNPIGISNCDYTITDNRAEIKCRFNTPYKIYSCYRVLSMTTMEKVVKQSLVNSEGENLAIDVTTSYTSEYEEKGNYTDESDITALLYQHTIVDVVRENPSYDNAIYRYKSIDVDFYITYFEDAGTKETQKITDATNDSIFKISSNDLIQSQSYYTEDSWTMPLATHILKEVSSRYSNGIECFEIECLFNEYVNESGEVVFDGKDLSQHFKRYDVIIPYVSKNGKTIPLRTNPDGTPKKFRIIGISYSYDGLLRQKLSVQEERYDVD